MRKKPSKAGRPRRDPKDIVRFHVLCYMIRGVDDDLIRAFNQLDSRDRWQFIKDAIRTTISDDWLHINLVPGEDDDLIAKLGGTPSERASQAKGMMRTGIIEDVSADEDAGMIDDLLDL